MTKPRARFKHIPVFQNAGRPISDREVLDAKDLLRPDEVGVILRLSRSQVYEMVAVGELEGTNGRPLRIKSSSVRRCLDRLTGPQH